MGNANANPLVSRTGASIRHITAVAGPMRTEAALQVTAMVPAGRLKPFAGR